MYTLIEVIPKRKGLLISWWFQDGFYEKCLFLFGFEVYVKCASLGEICDMPFLPLINDDKETVKYKKERTYYY